MEPSQIALLAKAIAAESAADALPFWITYLVLAFVIGAAASYFGTYFAKRGEVQAAKADREAILEALRQTTRASEEVRSAIAFGEWTERERLALRRAKLEEMLLLAHRANFWAQDLFYKEIIQFDFNIRIELEPSPMPMTLALGALYFPELRNLLGDFRAAFGAYETCVYDIRQEGLTAYSNAQGSDAAKQSAALATISKYQTRRHDAYTHMYETLCRLETGAVQLMTEFIRPQAAQAPGAG